MIQNEPISFDPSRTTICEICGTCYVAIQKSRYEQSKHHKYNVFLRNNYVDDKIQDLKILKNIQQMVNVVLTTEIKKKENIISVKKK